MTIDYTTFDADNHYYEATDAFTRYLDKGMARRTMQWAEIDGRQRLLVAGIGQPLHPQPDVRPGGQAGQPRRVLPWPQPAGRGHRRAVRRPRADPPRVPRPRRPSGRHGRPGHRRLLPVPDARAWAWRRPWADDPEAAVAAFHAFNRWLEDDWGYAYRDRIFAAPMIPLVDVDAAVAELEPVLARGARIVCIKSGPAITRDGRVSPGDARFDPFWARVDEAGVTVGIHSGDAGYNRYIDDWEQVGTFRAFAYSPLRIVLSAEPPPLRHHGRAGLPGRLRPLPERPGGQHRGRRRLGTRPPQEARQGLRAEPDGLRLRPGGHVPPARVDRPLLRGRHGPAEGRSSDSTTSCSARTGRTPRAWPSRPTFAEDLRRCGFTDEEIRTVMRDNGRRLTGPALVSP